MAELFLENPTSIPYPGSVPGPGEEGRNARGKLYPRNPGQSEDDVWERYRRQQENKGCLPKWLRRILRQH